MPAGPATTSQITQLLGPLLADHERIKRYRAIAIKRATGGPRRITRLAAPRTSAFHELRRQLEERHGRSIRRRTGTAVSPTAASPTVASPTAVRSTAALPTAHVLRHP